MTDREKVQQIGSIPKENAFPGSKSQRSVSCVNTFREFLTPGIPVHLMVTQATIWGFSGGQTQYFNPLQRRALVRLFGPNNNICWRNEFRKSNISQPDPFSGVPARLPQYFPAKLGQIGGILQAKNAL